MPEQHAKVGLGGSTASRTINCPGWRKLAETLPRQGSSAAANEGTMLHEAMSLILDCKSDPAAVVGMQYGDAELTQELYNDKIAPALTAFDTEYRDLSFYVEEKVNLYLVPGAWGTADIIGQKDDGTIVVLDWKFGDGIIVSAKENDQLQFYAAGVLNTFKLLLDFDTDTKVELVIIQPARGLEDIVSTWTTTVKDLRTWELTFAAAVRAGDHDDAIMQLGKWCKFCPCAANCPKMTTCVNSALNTSPANMYPNDTSVWLEKADLLEDWIKAIRSQAYNALQGGQEVPGWKLVNRRARRSWKDVDAARAWLAKENVPVAEYMDMKFKTPAQIEKILKGKEVAVDKLGDFVQSVSSGTVLAPVTDKRPEVQLGGLAKAAEILAASLGK